jgi:hypothetical protein
VAKKEEEAEGDVAKICKLFNSICENEKGGEQKWAKVRHWAASELVWF